jgi:hypothetical protein
MTLAGNARLFDSRVEPVRGFMRLIKNAGGADFVRAKAWA